MTNPFFRSVRRVRATRLTQSLERGAKVGLRALGNWWSQTGTIDQELANRAARSEFFAAAGKFAGYSGLGALLSYGLGFLTNDNPANDNSSFPLALGTRSPRLGFGGRAERGPERGSLADPVFSKIVKQMVFADQFTRSRLKVSPAVEAFLGGPDTTLGQRPPTLVEMAERAATDLGIGRVLNPKGWVPAVPFRMVPSATVITATAPGFGDFTPPAPIPRLEVPFDPNAGPPAPSSSSSTSSPSRAGKGGRLPPTPLNWPKIGLFTGATIGGAYLLRQLVGGNPYAGGSVAPISAPVPVPTTPGPGTAPNVGSFALGSYSGPVGDCGCGPRGPRRKCLERAPVAWRSGRNKGKAAGSKCVRYAQRAS
jgi:hypothetical protein